MTNIPSKLIYTESHEWIRIEENNEVVIGITEHAQGLLGDMVLVELPEIGRKVDKDEDCALAESVKAASDIYSPLSGEVIAVNEDLEDSPENVNSDPFGDGWIMRLKISDPAELEDLLDAKSYTQLLSD